MSSSIHPTAIIDSKAQIGSEVEIGPYSVIGPEVTIGNKCRIGAHVVIEGRTTLGEECEVFQFAALGAAPQDLKFGGEPSTLAIGMRNKIREFVTMHRGTVGGHMTTIVGDSNLFMAYSHVAHDCVIGNDNVLANSVALGGHVQIGDHVTLGGLCAVHQFSRIGSFAFLGGGTMASMDVPPYCIAQGDRAHLRGINLIGLERAGFSSDEVSEVKKAYRVLFSTAGKLEPRIASFPAELSRRPLVKALLDFIKSSERGICTPLKSLTS